jgi:hypothetical protein
MPASPALKDAATTSLGGFDDRLGRTARGSPMAGLPQRFLHAEDRSIVRCGLATGELWSSSVRYLRIAVSDIVPSHKSNSLQKGARMADIRWRICRKCGRQFTFTDAPRASRVPQCLGCGSLDADLVVQRPRLDPA